MGIMALTENQMRAFEMAGRVIAEECKVHAKNSGYELDIDYDFDDLGDREYVKDLAETLKINWSLNRIQIWKTVRRGYQSILRADK